MNEPEGAPSARAIDPMAPEPVEGGAAASGRRATGEDLETVGRLLAGDESAFVALVERYHQNLVRLAMIFVADRPTAEEVAQETWRGVLSGLARFEGRSSLKTWIFRILANRASAGLPETQRAVVTLRDISAARAGEAPWGSWKSVLTCRELTEVITDYLEGRLSILEWLRFQMHVGMCRHCRAYLRQMRATIGALGSPGFDPLPAEMSEDLLRRFRSWKRWGPGGR